MRRVPLVIGLASCLVLAAPPSTRADDCEAARCATERAIAASCPCDEASNHGRYVSCVARQVRALVASGAVPPRCKGKVVRCAARSTCGKRAGFVTCRIPVDTCDLATGTCTGDPTVACATDLDCGARCKIASSAERCTARGGTPGTGSCCDACGP